MQFPTVEECDFDRQFLFDEYVASSHRAWPEITDKMAANSISYAHNELILRNQDGGYYTVFYYRQY
jgi:hypothetical protein